MSAGVLFTDEAKKRVAGAIKEIESKTSAEIVVVVRRVSGRYREADYLAGAVTAFAMLLAVLFHPQVVPLESIPIDVALAFVVGAVLTAYVEPVKRLLAGHKTMTARVRTAARAAFVEQGVSRTRGRTGLLVYISTFERRIELVADLGAAPALAKEAGKRASESLGAVLERGTTLDAFVAALAALGPALAEELPRQEDDENELPDEPVTE